jgi:polyisoprenyl-teichoic acid--peptidoglycan teichoic acid transferase
MQLTRTRFLINRLRRQLFSRIRLIRVGLLILVLTLFTATGFLLKQPITRTVSFFHQFSGSVLTDHLGRTNFLIMGMSGGDHAGSDLTDTMIFISVNQPDKKVALISIPRDIWVTSMRAKINTAYHYGYLKAATTGGMLLAKSSVSETINQPVDYAVILDFSTFEKAIDTIGGIDLRVDRTFDDSHFPIAGHENDPCGGDPDLACRYETLHFTAGLQHVDGATALKFVRSRYSTDLVEGTDFGRSQRQEKVILAFMTKLISPDVFKHPSLYLKLYRLFSDSTITDLLPAQYTSLARLVFSLRHTHPSSFTISQPEELDNPPVSPRYDNQWVLVPKNDNPQIIYDFVSKALGTP